LLWKNWTLDSALITKNSVSEQVRKPAWRTGLLKFTWKLAIKMEMVMVVVPWWQFFYFTAVHIFIQLLFSSEQINHSFIFSYIKFLLELHF